MPTAVLSGAVGGSFGPFPRSSTFTADGRAPFLRRDSLASSTSLLRESQHAPELTFDPPYRHNCPASESGDELSSPPLGASAGFRESTALSSGIFGEQDASLLWNDDNKEPDDYLHVSRRPLNIVTP